MTVNDIVRLIEAATKLLAVVVWPAMLLFLVIRFRSGFQDFIASMGEVSFKGAGFEASAKRKAEAAAALGAAAATHANADTSPGAAAADARAAAEVVNEIVTPRLLRRAGKATVLWVDDSPANNVHERQALEALGIKFVLATSTDQALEKLKSQSVDAIISDMGRPPDSRAGYTLLERLRASGDQTPYIIYAGSRAPEHQTDARRRGAIGCTNRPDELFEMVLDAIRRRNSS